MEVNFSAHAHVKCSEFEPCIFFRGRCFEIHIQSLEESASRNSRFHWALNSETAEHCNPFGFCIHLMNKSA
jgi:hypothetical protein